MKKLIPIAISAALFPAATCEDLPPGAQCTFQGAYHVLSDPRPKKGKPCQPSGLDGPFTVDEPLTVACDTQDDLGTVCLPTPDGVPVEYCYGVLQAGGCTYDVLTVREE
jgi:hypothetical protein